LAEVEAKTKSDVPARVARAGLTVALVPVALHAFRDQYGYVPLLSDVNLAVHEFGHMLFMPFGIPVLGETAVILGGSLVQVAFPLVFVAYFLFSRQRKDVHAAMVCLWWTSINVLSVAIYANDARAGVLMLITGETGQESDAHDWNNLLTRWGALNKDHIIAGNMRKTAVLLCAVSVVVGLGAALMQRNATLSVDVSGLNRRL
jgi:hypothetical protein